MDAPVCPTTSSDAPRLTVGISEAPVARNADIDCEIFGRAVIDLLDEAA